MDFVTTDCIYGLERQQLRLNRRHRRPACEDGTIHYRAGADLDFRPRAGGNDSKRCSSTPWPLGFDLEWLGLSFHIQVLLFLKPTVQKKSKFHLKDVISCAHSAKASILLTCFSLSRVFRFQRGLARGESASTESFVFILLKWTSALTSLQL